MYDKKLSEEWSAWVEESNPRGTREAEVFPYVRQWMAKHNPNTVVDVGCGQGSITQTIPSHVQYIGIDPSSFLIERAIKLYASAKRTFKIGDAYNIPLSEDITDATISIWVWSHLEHLEQASREMYRILRPNGKFLIITASPDTYEERKTFYDEYEIEGKLLTGTFNLGGGKALTNTTLYLHTQEEILSALKRVGLIIEHVDKLGQTKADNKGLYLVIEGRKYVK